MEKQALAAIKVADEILRLATTITDEEVEEALNKISMAKGTWGLLWGLKNLRTSGMDLDYYELKGKVLKFLRELRKEKAFNYAYIVTSRRTQ